MTVQAVLTGDIVNSTGLTAVMEKRLIRVILELFNAHKVEFFRGDSFQVYVKDPKEALKLALLSRTAAISLFKGEKAISSDIRISIGIGTVETPVKALRTAKGEAFLFSGRKFDEIAKSTCRLAIVAADPLAKEGLDIIADYINSIFEGMTGKQAEVIFELLKGEIQKSIAKKLRKTKSTIHQRIISGRWSEIERLLLHYENIINQLK